MYAFYNLVTWFEWNICMTCMYLLFTFACSNHVSFGFLIWNCQVGLFLLLSKLPKFCLSREGWMSQPKWHHFVVIPWRYSYVLAALMYSTGCDDPGCRYTFFCSSDAVEQNGPRITRRSLSARACCVVSCSVQSPILSLWSGVPCKIIRTASHVIVQTNPAPDYAVKCCLWTRPFWGKKVLFCIAAAS